MTTGYTNQWREKYRQNAIAKYVAEHGEIPLCKCGCGERVKPHSSNAKVPKYAGVGHQLNDPEYAELHSNKMREWHQLRREKDGSLDAEKLREYLRNYKKERNLKWAEIAEIGGISKNHMSVVMFDKRLKSFTYKWSWEFLRRLNGMSAPPSKYQMRKIEENKTKYRKLEKQYALN